MTMAKSTGNTPVQKNEQLTITIEDITHEGSGVGKVGGYPLCRPNLPCLLWRLPAPAYELCPSIANETESGP